MGRDTGIADRLRAAGLAVVEVDGWQSRGSSEFNPRGSVNHHTAGAPTGNIPSLDVLIYGRADLPGPLCNVALARNGDAYVISAGRANHAGEGGWRGLSGNSSVYGLEIEHVGTAAEPWTAERVDIAARIHAAMLRDRADASMCCQHKEWAPSRKVDAYAADGATFRERVAHHLAHPGPDQPPEGTVTMFVAINGVGLYALLGQVLFTFRSFDAYTQAVESSPGVPVVGIGDRCPLNERQELFNELVRQHNAATRD